MKTEVKICDKNRIINSNKITKIINDIDDDIEIIVGCNNFCAICRTKGVAVINNMPIIKDTEEELIEEIKRRLIKNE
jgi:uncharacterized protein YuzB (UPF0349 family)